MKSGDEKREAGAYVAVAEMEAIGLIRGAKPSLAWEPYAAGLMRVIGSEMGHFQITFGSLCRLAYGASMGVFAGVSNATKGDPP